jgi:methionyl-tRNA formyltransferase
MEAVYADLATKLASCILRGKIPRGERQKESRATYSLWRDERDYRLDFKQPAALLRRKIDALSFPHPGAACMIDAREFKVLEAESIPDLKIENRDCGKVIFYREERPVVVCGEGLLRIDRLVDSDGKDVPFPLKNFRTRFE